LRCLVGWAPLAVLWRRIHLLLLLLLLLLMTMTVLVV
jgi:hypothetical protein